MAARRHIAIFLASAMLIVSCAEERPTKTVLPNARRLPKTALQGEFVFLRSLGAVRYPGDKHHELVPGMYLDSDKIVRFDQREESVDAVAVDLQVQEARPAERNAVVASFAARHVDVLRKQNPDGEDTHEEEETDSRRPWRERALVVLDPSKDSAAELATTTVSARTDRIEHDASTGSLFFLVTRRLDDGTEVEEKLSFLPYRPSGAYVPREYPRLMQKRFGYFKTVRDSFGRNGTVTTRDRRELMNRRDVSRPVRYYLTPGFPQHLKPIARSIVAGWNSAFRSAIGREPLELVEDATVEPGDLRYSVIHYDSTPYVGNGILGYGPSVTDPRTGEILKADVILYGGTLRWAVFAERWWEDLLSPRRRAGLPDVIPPMSSGAPILQPLGAIAAEIETGVRVGERDALTPAQRAEWARREMTPSKLIERLRAQFHGPLAQRITKVPQGLPSQLGPSGARKTESELEEQVFRPLLAHELGHTLGLRHNFKGSADRAHWPKTAQKGDEREGAPTPASSSIMDYAFLSAHEPSPVGDYDRAAIAFGYGADKQDGDEPLAGNYLFCTDEDAFSALDGLCNPYDAGDTLVEAIDHQLKRYIASYVFNNVRLNRIHFHDSLPRYLEKVSSILVPIRLIYDHAEAILQANARKAKPVLWRLLRERIAADDRTALNDDETIIVTEDQSVGTGREGLHFPSSTFQRRIDKQKIEIAVADARLAKVKALQAFARIILHHELGAGADAITRELQARPDYDTEDLVHGEIQRRGILPDRMLALMLAGSRTAHPLSRRADLTVFGSFPFDLPASEQGLAAELVASVISDTWVPPVTREKPDPVRERRPVALELSLRRLAFKLVEHELVPSSDAANARQLLAVEKVPLDPEEILRRPEPALSDEERAFAAVAAVRRDIQTQLVSLNRGNLGRPEEAEIERRVLALERTRANLPAAYAKPTLGRDFYRAPMRVAGFPYPTATGYLVRDNLNRDETLIAVYTEVRALARQQLDEDLRRPIIEQDRILQSKLQTRLEQLASLLDDLEKRKAVEQELIEDIHHFYMRRSD